MIVLAGDVMFFQNQDSQSSYRQTPENSSLSPSAKNSTPHVLQLAKKIGNKAMTHLLQKQSNNQPVIQGKFKGIEPTDYKADGYKNNQNNEGQFTAVQADKGLPTFFGVLKDTYGEDNVNKSFFSKTEVLGDTCDRPHSVTAIVKKGTSRKDRKGDPVVSAIGNLGTEERMIRDGKNDAAKTAYDGGHLVGYQIIRGIEANQAWNIAPQDVKNNEHSYNNTIEKMLRGAGKGTEYTYSVEVKYDQWNFSVDQEQLVKLGALKQVDSTKPWEIQLPVRIPFKWDAKADMTKKDEKKWKFASPTEGESSFEQFSQTMDEGNLDFTRKSHTARFNLAFSDQDGNEELYDIDSNNFDSKSVKGIRYSMHQSLPTDFLKNQKPVEWMGDEANAVAHFGEVNKGQASSTNIFEIMPAKLKRNKILIDEIEEMGDVEKPEKMRFIPEGISQLDGRDEKKCVFIYQLDKNKIRNEYMTLKKIEADYYPFFNVQQEEEEKFEKEKEEFDNIANEFATCIEDLDNKKKDEIESIQQTMAQYRKILEAQTLTLTRIKNHRIGRNLYKETVKEIYPLYKEKILCSLQVLRAITGYDSDIEYDNGDKKSDSKNKPNMNGKRTLEAREDKRKKRKDDKEQQQEYKKIIEKATGKYLRKSVEDYLNKK
ncbi:hypothetical protein [Brevibacillus sp. DP1.3A]|uniref:hypothetical protein n=1 Tax=Brevibacillus sp. DP1.3A TaxID=2738867 RepID=UPI001D16F163|nr:hypothetical protein [Brevibacillus sp. DP1.3A]UED72464.1 hypothetical protein HP399_017055 [Brevibacillus sp. DP1.3A]